MLHKINWVVRGFSIVKLYLSYICKSSIKYKKTGFGSFGLHVKYKFPGETTLIGVTFSNDRCTPITGGRSVVSVSPKNFKELSPPTHQFLLKDLRNVIKSTLHYTKVWSFLFRTQLFFPGKNFAASTSAKILDFSNPISYFVVTPLSNFCHHDKDRNCPLLRQTPYFS